MTDHDSVPPSETALYIEKMCNELRNLAARSELNLLAYLLEVAREEAAQQTVSIRPVPEQQNKIGEA